jgi:fucose permease
MAGWHDGTAVTITAAFVFGMVLALLGSLKLALARRLNIGEPSVGWLLAGLNLAILPMMLLSGMVIDSVGVRGVLLVGSLVTACGLFALALATSFATAQVAVLCIGVGGACLSTGSVVLMPRVFFPDNEAASLNLGNVFFGLGALVTPALAELLLLHLEYRRAVGLMALVCLVPAVFASITGGAALAVQPGELNYAGVLTNPIVWIAGAVFFCYSPLEGSIGTWATTYLTDLGHSEKQAAFFLSGFWLTFLGSRLGVAYLQRQEFLGKAAEPWLLVGLAIAAAVCLGNLAGAHTKAPGSIGMLLVGACLGPIFPTLVAMLYQCFDTRQHGTAYGTMFSIGSFGSLLLPPIIGNYARQRSLRQAMRIPMLLAVLLALAAVVFGLVTGTVRRI